MNTELTFGSWFSGIGGVDSAAEKLGLISKFLVEKDYKICKIASLNFKNVLNQDVLTIPFSNYEFVDIFHCSPPCINFSKNIKKGEQEEDVLFANKIVDYLTRIHPTIFTFENVPEYERSKSFKIIYEYIKKSYSFVKYSIYDFSNYGLPQNRKRLFLQASDKDFKLPEVCEKVSWDKVVNIQGKRTSNHLKSLRHFNLNDVKVITTTRNNTWKNIIREVGECAPTVISTEYKGGLLIIENGNAYKLGVQDFAKLQGFYDDFNFGERKVIATKGIGNTVPPMIYYKFLKEMI